MKRMSILLVALTVVSSATGCGCCRWLFPAPAQHVVAAPPAPACPPPVMYDPCATAPVTYGMPVSPAYSAPEW